MKRTSNRLGSARSLLESLWQSLVVETEGARSLRSQEASGGAGKLARAQVLDAQRRFEKASKKRVAREKEGLELDEEIARIEARRVNQQRACRGQGGGERCAGQAARARAEAGRS